MLRRLAGHAGAWSNFIGGNRTFGPRALADCAWVCRLDAAERPRHGEPRISHGPAPFTSTSAKRHDASSSSLPFDASSRTARRKIDSRALADHATANPFRCMTTGRRRFKTIPGLSARVTIVVYERWRTWRPLDEPERSFPPQRNCSPPTDAALRLLQAARTGSYRTTKSSSRSHHTCGDIPLSGNRSFDTGASRDPNAKPHPLRSPHS